MRPCNQQRPRRFWEHFIVRLPWRLSPPLPPLHSTPPTSSLPLPTRCAPTDLHSSTGFYHIYCSLSFQVRFVDVSSSLLQIVELITKNLRAARPQTGDHFWETCCVFTSGGVRNGRFRDHCIICMEVTRSYPTGKVLSDESKMLAVNSGCEGGKQPDNNCCLSLMFGSEPGGNQSWKIQLIQTDRMTPWFITCRIYFNDETEITFALFFSLIMCFCYMRDSIIYDSWVKLTNSKRFFQFFFFAFPDFHFLSLILQQLTTPSSELAENGIKKTYRRVTAAGVGSSHHARNLRNSFKKIGVFFWMAPKIHP